MHIYIYASCAESVKNVKYNEWTSTFMGLHINLIIIINPRRACAQRGLLQLSRVCVCVRTILPPHTLQSQKRDTNGLIAIQEHFTIFLNDSFNIIIVMA